MINEFFYSIDVSIKQVGGALKDVPDHEVLQWEKKFRALIEGFQAKDAYNKDGIGLFYRALSRKYLVKRGSE